MPSIPDRGRVCPLPASPLDARPSKASRLESWLAGIEVEGYEVNDGVDAGVAKGLGILGKGIEARD